MKITNKNSLFPDNLEDLKFGPNTIPASTIFLHTQHSFAFVNLKPVLPGHVLVSPKRLVERLHDLTDIETSDLFNVAKRVQKVLEDFYGVQSATLCVQDGPAAGQTVKVGKALILFPHRRLDFNLISVFFFFVACLSMHLLNILKHCIIPQISSK